MTHQPPELMFAMHWERTFSNSLLRRLAKGPMEAEVKAQSETVMEADNISFSSPRGLMSDPGALRMPANITLATFSLISSLAGPKHVWDMASHVFKHQHLGQNVRSPEPS